uniref:Uncharacterized protein n=1 Tax=Cacopsylla melanoneura TaxID=428564 RepID=A0A8D8U669_9HEMI
MGTEIRPHHRATQTGVPLPGPRRRHSGVPPMVLHRSNPAMALMVTLAAARRAATATTGTGTCPRTGPLLRPLLGRRPVEPRVPRLPDPTPRVRPLANHLQTIRVTGRTLSINRSRPTTLVGTTQAPTQGHPGLTNTRALPAGINLLSRAAA